MNATSTAGIPAEPAGMRIVAVVVCLGLLAGMALSWRLWIPLRDYPTVPVAAWLDAPVWVSAALTALAAAMSMLLCLRLLRPALLVLPATLAALFLLDQSRLQPWAVLYAGLLLALGGLGLGRRADPDAALQVCRVIFAAMYFWSGIQKLNPYFAADVLPWFVAGIEAWLPLSLPAATPATGYAVALLEAAVGAALLIPRASRVAALLAIGMHALVLAALGPWGHNWNSVVWPWNVAAAALVGLLFLRRESVAPALSVLRRPLGAALAAFYGLLPALSLLGPWDAYLSSALYSGNVAKAVLELDAASYSRLPRAVQSQAVEYPGGYRLDLYAWSFSELNVPPYPEPRIYVAVARKLCREIGSAEGVSLTVEPRQPSWGARRQRMTYSRALLEP